jgi:hypothetical protein
MEEKDDEGEGVGLFARRSLKDEDVEMKDALLSHDDLM